MTSAPRSRLFTQSTDATFVPAGTVLFTAGEPGDFMYVVKSGEVELYVDGQLVETAGEGAIFGELALLDGDVRSSTAVALTDTELVKIDQRRFTFLVQQTPFFALEVMRTLADRLRRMNDRLLSGAPG